MDRDVLTTWVVPGECDSSVTTLRVVSVVVLDAASVVGFEATIVFYVPWYPARAR